MKSHMKVFSPVLSREQKLNRISCKFGLDEVEQKSFYFLSPEPLNADVDCVFPVSLLWGMRMNRDLFFEGAVSERLLENAEKIQEIFCVWFDDFKQIKVNADRISRSVNRSGKTACFFTGGVDSFFTLLKHVNEIDALVYVHGFDVKLSDSTLRRQVSDSLKKVAAVFNKELIELESDIRTCVDPYLNWGLHGHGASLAVSAHLLGKKFSKFFIPASHTYKSLFPWGSHPLIDPLWSSECVQIIHDGCEVRRTEKILQISKNITALSYLRVCWVNPGSAYNCGVCEKCQRTMITLEVAGKLAECKTFEKELSYARVRRIRVSGDNVTAFVNDNYQLLKDRADCPELKAALEDALSGIYQGGVLFWPKRIFNFIKRQVTKL